MPDKQLGISCMRGESGVAPRWVQHFVRKVMCGTQEHRVSIEYLSLFFVLVLLVLQVCQHPPPHFSGVSRFCRKFSRFPVTSACSLSCFLFVPATTSSVVRCTSVQLSRVPVRFPGRERERERENPIMYFTLAFHLLHEATDKPDRFPLQSWHARTGSELVGESQSHAKDKLCPRCW